MLKKKSSVWLNSKQLSFISAEQKDKTWIGGRGTGKSVCIGASTRLKMGWLPRAKGLFSSTTYNQILTKTLPPIEDHWRSCGFREWVSPKEPGHYIIGRRPPSNWEMPYSRPRKYDNVISFFNGFTIELLSMDRPDLARGGSYDFAEIDESALVPKEHQDKIIIPSLRGNTHRFTHWSHQQLCRYSSMPWQVKGQYLLEYEEKARLHPSSYYYQESTAYDNIEILTQAGIDRMEREMDHLSFVVEILNHRITRSSHAFYHRFDDGYHTYTPAYIYGESEARGISVIGMKDRNRHRPIEASFDFSGWFKCATIFQEEYNTEYMRDSFYINQNGGVAQLVDNICIAFCDQIDKNVNIWGEPIGNELRAEGGTIFDIIVDRFKANGWIPHLMVPSEKSAFHELRYEYMNDVLAEEDPSLPRLRINQDTCKAVIISINNAEVTDSFKKSKKDEKNKSFNQAHATHFTDTIDYYFWQKYKSGRQLYLPGRGHQRIA